jgi:hypothetical protein
VGASWESEWGLERLLGEWRIEREIPGQGSMSGIASFVVAGDSGVLYRESGEVRLHDGTRLRGEQCYFYKAITNGFAVYFHDSAELFERVTFLGGEGEAWVGRAEHLCKSDVYASRYVFYGDGTFEIRHAVRGPRKDYSIQTRYQR